MLVKGSPGHLELPGYPDSPKIQWPHWDIHIIISENAVMGLAWLITECSLWDQCNDSPWPHISECIVNTLRPRQNGRHFADDIFKCIFLNENVWISIKISLKFVPKGPINNIPVLVQIMAWRRQATSHYLDQWWFVHWRIYASLGLNELTHCGVVMLYDESDLGQHWVS